MISTIMTMPVVVRRELAYLAKLRSSHGELFNDSLPLFTIMGQIRAGRLGLLYVLLR